MAFKQADQIRGRDSYFRCYSSGLWKLQYQRRLDSGEWLGLGYGGVLFRARQRTLRGRLSAARQPIAEVVQLLERRVADRQGARAAAIVDLDIETEQRGEIGFQ